LSKHPFISYIDFVFGTIDWASGRVSAL